MNRILVFTPSEDQCGRAVALGAALAQRTGASLTLCRVLEESPAGHLSAGPAQLDGKLRDLLIDSESRALRQIAESLRARSQEPLEVDIEVHWGVPWEVVIELVEQDGFDLVIKPARGLSHSGRVFFGSTALHLFRRCPCPVWVVGDDGHLPRRILLSIDPSLDQTRRQMASKLLEWGDSIRIASGAELEVASAWQAQGADVLKERLEQWEFDAYVSDAREHAENGLKAILQGSASAAAVTRSHLLAGSAREIIPEFAGNREFNLVLVGTLGRTGVVGEILGETAELILRGVRCSVLAISPRHRSPFDRAG